MATQEIVKKILSLKPDLTEEAVYEMIQEERTRAAGLLTEEAAAHLVASKLGVQGRDERVRARLRIADLTPGLSDVSFTARVIHVFPGRVFERGDGRKGKVLRVLMGDSSGSVVVVFWDEKADHVEAAQLGPGKVVRVVHGYTRERRGSVEVNVGGRGNLVLEPLEASTIELPDVGAFFKSPGEVYSEGPTNLEGVVVDSYPPSSFVRSDGSEGKVSRLVLEEGGGRINLVLWDDNVDRFGQLERGTRIRVVQCNVRLNNRGVLEAHVGWATQILVVDRGVKPVEPLPYWTKIGDLERRRGRVNVVGLVANIGEVREFTRGDGSTGRVANILLEDETGVVRVSLWDEDADLVRQLREGMTVVVENGYTRDGLGSVELSLGRDGRFHIEPEDLEMEVPEVERRITEIIDLREGMRNVTIRGQLLDDPVRREVETSRGPASVTSFRIDDGTGEARVSLWRELGEEAMDLSAGAVVRLEYVNVREPFDGVIQVSSGAFTRMIVETP